jgi:site-specific recombinase XerD
MGDIRLRKALDDYKTVYMPYRNFAKRTRVEYQNDAGDWVEFLEKSGINHVKAIGIPIIERYVAHLEQEGLASVTRKRRVVAIRSFLAFLYQDGYIDTNIAKRIVLPFTESSMPYVLTQTECDRIRQACAGNPRDRATIEILLQTGIKLSEITRLTLNDISFGEDQSGFMRMLASRGKRERIIPLNIKVSVAIKNYLDARKNIGNNILFLNRFGEPIGERGVQKMFRKYLQKAEVGRATVQTLRHTFGAQHIAKGTSLKTIQEVMGLKDARSTTIYHALAKKVVSRELQENAL